VCGGEESSASFVVFGGLSGDDENPVRLDDTWLLSVNVDE